MSRDLCIHGSKLMFTKYDTRQDKVFIFFVYVFMVLMTITFIYPFWDQLVMSLSTAADALKHEVRLYPWPVSLAGYREVLASRRLVRCFWNSIRRVAGGVTWTLFVTSLAAYPLSQARFPFKKLFMAMILFTMMFDGGLIPNYLLRKSLGLLNTFVVLILPGVGAWNIIIMRNFFMSIPEEIQESAKLDGASDFNIYWQILLPLSKPVLATVALWSAVGHWNAYFDVLIYVQDATKQTLQVLLRYVLIEGREEEAGMFGMAQAESGRAGIERPTTETLKAALLLVTTVPILLVYPFIQRYFVKGIMLGSVKG